MPRGPSSFRIINATLILPDRLIPNGAIDISDGRLTAVAPQEDLPSWSGPTLDAGGEFVAPGYIDLHVHGGDNADFMDGTPEAFETVIRAHTRHGVTSIVPTSTVAPHEQTIGFSRAHGRCSAAAPSRNTGLRGRLARICMDRTSRRTRSGVTRSCQPGRRQASSSTRICVLQTCC